NTLGGFSIINEVHADKNSTGFRAKEMLRNGRRYKSVVHVRRGLIAASVDGKLVAEYKTGISDLRIPIEWGVGDGLLGVYSWASPTIIHALEIAEITGKGERRSLLPAGDVPGLGKPAPQDKPLRPPIDLMMMVDLNKDGMQGVWRRAGNDLICAG